MESTNDARDPRAFRATADVVKDLQDLTQQTGFLYSLAIILRRDLFFEPAKALEIDWRKQLSIQELSFLLGLMVKRPIDTHILPSEEQALAQIADADRLFRELHDAHMAPFVAKLQGEFAARTAGAAGTPYEEFFGSGQLVTETIFYGGSPAYDFQLWDYAPEKYQHDGSWLKNHGNLDLTAIVAISRHLKAMHEEKMRVTPPARSFADFCRSTLSIFCFTREELHAFPSEALDAFLSAFALTPGTVNQALDHVGGSNAVEATPVIILGAERHFLPISFNLAQAIYESPYYWMLADDSYRATALKHRGDYAESMAEALLASVFGQDRVWRNVGVYRSKHEMITDIDVLAIAGNRAVIIQAKSKRLTELAKRGDDERLREDFAAAIQSAYEQGALARHAILDRAMILKTTGGQILDLAERIEDAYIICLTADHYPALAHQTSVYLKKRGVDPDPLSMSIFDLDVIVSYLMDPYDLLYYLRQRTQWSRHFRADSEVVLLGYHIESKLYPRPGASMEALDGSIAAAIDADLPVRRGERIPVAGTKGLRCIWLSNELREVIDDLKRTGHPGFTDAIFLLYDLSTRSANGLMQAIRATKARSQQDGKMHSAAVEVDEAHWGLSYVCLSGTPGELARCVLGFAMAKKYRTKAEAWLGLGALMHSTKTVDAFSLIRGPWVEDAALETFSARMLKGGILVVPLWAKVGRNAPCPCGSGSKFKHCCGR